MGNIELLEKIDKKKCDPDGMLDHIERFPTLCHEAFELSKKYSIPSYFVKVKKVVFLGMGGSGQAGDIMKGLLSDTELTVESVHNYNLPGFVDSDTLVVANSYSGNTEETLAGFISAYEKGAKLIAITTGGKLKILAQKYKASLFSFDYQSVPRASFPYLFILLLAVFMKLGYVQLRDADIKKSISLLNEALTKYSSGSSSFQNPAKILAQKLHGKIPVVYSSEQLSGVAARIKAAFNENSKNFAFCEELPELNHKSLEGLLNPKSMTHIIMIESNFEFERTLLRENITSEIVTKNKVPLDRIKFIQAKDRLSEILLHVMFGDFVSFYLAVLNKANPGVNEVVDYLKNRLA